MITKYAATCLNADGTTSELNWGYTSGTSYGDITEKIITHYGKRLHSFSIVLDDEFSSADDVVITNVQSLSVKN